MTPYTTYEALSPILAVEHDSIVSKNGEITICFSLRLPELFSLSEEDYETIFDIWVQAISVLPEHSIFHKQDWYFTGQHRIDPGKERTLVDKLSDDHFFQRPFLQHRSFVYLTMTSKERSRSRSLGSYLCGAPLVPADINDRTIEVFEEAVARFVKIVNDSKYLELRRLTQDEILGTESADGFHFGLIDRVRNLEFSEEAAPVLEDVILKGETRVGNKRLVCYGLTSINSLPNTLSTDYKEPSYSTEKTSVRLSFTAPIAIQLPCDHLFNQYIFVENSAEMLKQLDDNYKTMTMFSLHDRKSSAVKEELNEFIVKQIKEQTRLVRAHVNVMAWGYSDQQTAQLGSLIHSRFGHIRCIPKSSQIDLPHYYWAQIPGNSPDLPSEETFLCELPHAVTLLANETNYRDSPSPYGIKLTDRLSGRPIHLDITYWPKSVGIIQNLNKFVLGPSGSGKSFATNHLVREYYDQGAHVFIVDIGHSYRMLCELVRELTHGEDGIYFSFSEGSSISFNPFYKEGSWKQDDFETIVALLFCLWKNKTQSISNSEEATLSAAVQLYIRKVEKEGLEANFNGFYDYLNAEFKTYLKVNKINIKEFDVDNFRTAIMPYYKGGMYEDLLNSPMKIDLFYKRFVVFDLDSIKESKMLPIVQMIIIQNYTRKLIDDRLKPFHKLLILEEAWRAMMNPQMEVFIKYVYRTARKHNGEVMVVTQDLDDLISSEIVKETIITNSDCKILLDQSKKVNTFDQVQSVLGITRKNVEQILSINRNNDAKRRYKELWIGLGTTHSAVYGLEVSPHEYVLYTTEAEEKAILLEAIRQCGSIRQAMIEIGENLREGKGFVFHEREHSEKRTQSFAETNTVV